MKKVLLVTLFFALFFLLTGKGIAFAETSKEEVEEKIETEIGEYVDSLDLDEFEKYIRSLEGTEGWKSSSLSETITRFTKGELPIGPTDLLKYLGEKALGALTGTLAALLTVMIIAVLNSILSGMTSGFVKKQTIEIVHYVCYALVVSIVMAKVGAIVMECREFCKGVSAFTQGVYPPLITLMSALGGSVSSSIYKPQLAIFSVIISKVFGSVILPLFVASISFCLIGNLSSSVKMDKIQSAIRYCSNLIVTCLFGIFMTYLTVAGITGGMVDGVSIKAAKFVLSGYVPILGGYLSQGFDLISAGCVLIKNAIGMIGIITVLYMIIKPIVHIVVFSFALKIVASLIQPIGDKHVSDFLYSVSNATKILITAILGTGFVLILSLLLMVVTCNVGVM